MSSESSVGALVEAFRFRLRTNNPKTDRLRQTRQSVLRSADPELKLLALRAFVQNAVECFVAGDAREGRRWYDGAFHFGKKTLVRRELFDACLEAAVVQLGLGAQQVVWRLLDLVIAFPPDGLTAEQVNRRFAMAGVDVSVLDPPEPEEPHWRLHSLKHVYPALVAA